MTSFFTSRLVLPVKVHKYYAMEDTAIACGYTDSVLPPLDSGTVRKINSTNALVQNRFELFKNKLLKEKEEAKMRFFVKRQDFVRSSIVLQERKRLASRKKSRLRSKDDKKSESFNEEKTPSTQSLSKDDLITHENGSSTTRENSLNMDTATPLRPPFFLPPLHKNMILNLKDAKERQERQKVNWRLNEIKVEDVQSCRYLRIAGMAKLMFDSVKENEDGLFNLKINKIPSNEDDKL
jgi:hypothetical protein